MAIRNFWIEGFADGRKTSCSFGPRAKNGGFTLSVKQREDNGIFKSVEIEGMADDDGTLTVVLNVVQPNGKMQSINVKTKR